MSTGRRHMYRDDKAPEEGDDQEIQAKKLADPAYIIIIIIIYIYIYTYICIHTYAHMYLS